MSDTARQAIEHLHALKSTRQFAAALRAADAALQQHPHHATLIGQKAHILHLMRRTDEGLRLLDESAHTIPLPDFVQSIRAELLAAADRVDEASLIIDGLLSRDRLSTPARTRCLDVLRRFGQQTRVDALLTQWVDETCGDARKSALLAQLRLGSAADEAQRRLRDEFGDDREVLERVAEYQLRDLPDDERADELAVLLSTSRGAGSTRLRLKRALALRKAGQVEEARDEVVRCLQTEPEDAFAHALLGYCWRDLDDLQQAIAAFEHALRLNPSDNYARTTLYATYKRLGDAARARAFTEEIAAAQPTLSGVYWAALQRAGLKKKSDSSLVP